ncbi:MAG TPA: phosphoribosylglycinamide formyltransferase [Rhodospirillales bacterium]|nr:phosphoribosylglycinamide formyltransferase [Rhodospirillales bacterium]
MAKLKLAVLISGRGSNLQSLIEACEGPDYRAEIVHVISNIPAVMGLDRAEQAGLPTTVVDHTKFADRESFETALGQVLQQAGTELICLAGFMRLLTGRFVIRWHDKLINIHPSLLPAFKGLDVHQRAIDAGVKFSGCTVHYVRPDMDSGPIIAQAAVPVLQNDDAQALAARIVEQEHVIYPLAVKLIAEGNIRIKNERVLFGNSDA